MLPPGVFCWFECANTDPEFARAFYRGLFGWEALDVPLPSDAAGQYTLFQIGGKDIAGMYELAGPEFVGVPSHWMIYISVDDATASAARAESLGGILLQAPMTVDGVGQIAVVEDPTGAAFAIFEAGDHAGTDPDVSNLGWCELHTTDPDAARDFYTSLFGWQVREDLENRYTEFEAHGRPIGGMSVSLGPDPPPHWLIYAAVADCDAALRAAADLGGEVIVPAEEIPDVGRFGVVCDPGGATLAVIKLTGPAA